MWQLRKKLLSLTERLHFGELNQLNGCGRAEREAGCVCQAEEFSGKRLLPRLNLFFFLFLLYWWSSDPSLSLSHFSKSIFSLKCPALSLLFFSFLYLFFYFGQITFSSSAPALTFISLFPQSLCCRQTDWWTDTQPVRPRWDEAGPRWIPQWNVVITLAH